MNRQLKHRVFNASRSLLLLCNLPQYVGLNLYMFCFADFAKPFAYWSMGTNNRTSDAAVSIELLGS